MALILNTFAEYSQQALRTKSEGFMRPTSEFYAADEHGVCKPVMEVYASGEKVDWLHGMTGLQTELAGEFCDPLKAHLFYGKPLDEVNLGEELGDCWWYVGITAPLLINAGYLGLNHIEGTIQGAHYENARMQPIQLLDLASATSRYITALNNGAVRLYLDEEAQVIPYDAVGSYLQIINNLICLGLGLGIPHQMIWQANIAKLYKRYPKKFDSVAAQFRSIKEEREILEAGLDTGTEASSTESTESTEAASAPATA